MLRRYNKYTTVFLYHIKQYFLISINLLNMEAIEYGTSIESIVQIAEWNIGKQEFKTIIKCNRYAWKWNVRNYFSLLYEMWYQIKIRYFIMLVWYEIFRYRKWNQKIVFWCQMIYYIYTVYILCQIILLVSANTKKWRCWRVR